ncbi:MAG TPA: sodium:solute symporter, partial [Roseivirga sp.]
MLGISITVYILFTLAIGYWASKRIKTTDDFTLAGRSLSTMFVGVTIFATWFGPELVMGMPALFSQEGIQGIITDQFGTFLCLVLIARFYTKKMYSMNVVTINDFFRIRYNQSIETFTSFVYILVYVLWISAQQLALALIFQSLFGIPIFWGLMLGATIVVVYTYM